MMRNRADCVWNKISKDIIFYIINLIARKDCEFEVERRARLERNAKPYKF